MEIKELMIGDWARFRHKDKTHPFQVTQIRESAFDGKLDVWAEGGNVGNDCIEPIPLTVEILENIGAIDCEEMNIDGDYVKSLYLEDEVCFRTETITLMAIDNDGNTQPYDRIKTDCFNGFICKELNFLPIDYVHQLQHALRLCGLNDLADNFKI